MWMWSKVYVTDVFVAKVGNGDIVTHMNPKTCKWDNGPLSEFSPPIMH